MFHGSGGDARHIGPGGKGNGGLEKSGTEIELEFGSFSLPADFLIVDRVSFYLSMKPGSWRVNLMST